MTSNLNRVVVHNVLTKFREAFETYGPNVDNVWLETKAAGDIIRLGGNAAACSYLVISKDPLTANTVSQVETLADFDMPFEAVAGLHMSQRTLGQEFAYELVDTAASLAAPADLAISSISQATTTLSVTTVLPHNLQVGARIGIVGCVDSRMNYPALVVATTPTPTTFTVTAGPGGALPSVTAGPFASGSVFYRTSMGYAPNGSSMLFENASATNASVYVRSEAGDVFPSGTIAGNHSVSFGSSASVQAINAALNYAFQPTTEYKLVSFVDGLQWSDVPVDSVAAASNRVKRTQVVPNPKSRYKLRFRAVNAKSLTVPNAAITLAAKSGTTTATITTATPHGLTITDQVVIYGLRDQTNFPNLTAATAVASVIDATNFTVVLGAAVTATSRGGYVARVQGGNLMSALGALTMSGQTATLTGGILTLVGSAAWSGVLIGDSVNLLGVVNDSTGVSLGIDGAWRVRDIQTTSLFLEPIGSTVPPVDFTVTNCGGGVIKRTELRVSFARVLDFQRQRVEPTSKPTGDNTNAMPVMVQNSITATVASTSANQGTRGTVGAGWYVEPDNVLVADVASAALTTTTTTAAITPTPAGGSAEFNIPVTVVTGTTPTLDVGIEESDDTGTNWYRIYDFPRITATGIYRSPMLPLTGNRLRYVQTVGGTTPSFTRAINRITHMMILPGPFRQIIDRAVAVNTLNATTGSIKTNGALVAQLVLNMGAITTTAPQLQLEGSDDNGASWYAIGAPLTGVASSTVQLSVSGINAELVRGRVSTAGSGATLGYALIKTHGY